MSNYRVSVHESGHAIIALAAGLRIESVTIVPDSDSVGHIALAHAESDRAESPLTDELSATVKTFEAVYAAAGEVAEGIAFGAATAGCECDQRTTSAAIETVGDLTGARPWAWRHTILDLARVYLTSNWDAVSLLALALVNERSISGARALEIVGGLPPLDLSPVEGAVAFSAARTRARESRRTSKTMAGNEAAGSATEGPPCRSGAHHAAPPPEPRDTRRGART